MASGYLEVLRAPYASRLLSSTLLGRLPNAVGHIAIVVHVREQGGGYALAGALAAVYGLATAAGQPLLGRAVDLRGQRAVLLPAAVLSALAMAAFAFTGITPRPLAYLLVGLAGLSTPPLEGALRALWPSVLGRADRVHTAYALEAVAQEVMFTAGPLLVTLLVALRSTTAALLVVNVLGVLGALSVVLSRPSRAWRGAAREAHWLGALRSPGLLALLGAFLFVGVALGSITVSALAYSDGAGGETAYGWIMAALGAGALVGGIAYGARVWTGRPEPRLRLLVALLALGYLPLLLTPDRWTMTGLALLAGVFLAPALACAFVAVDRHAPRGTVTEAFSWLVTTFGVGNALGTALAGPVLDAGGIRAGFAVAACGGVLAALVLVVTAPALEGRTGGAVAPETTGP
ncbi:transmembrane transporter [Streptomyces sp. SPB78]|uniref:MFS transporter n=1 Tax=Streptomyces sp. (strain SPB78) TaxID=591157 RepID=UPI0001B5433D|nr:MFS transporter [Streptomyces sp. SPB78]EFK98819.1 transmembrane transporter [Streptomyces sp. SPB78]